MQVSRFLSSMIVGMSVSASVWAAEWPKQAIKIVVGFSAGTSIDLQARLIAPRLSSALGQPVIVENKPGAGGAIAATVVAQATDNHTIGVMNNGPLTAIPALQKVAYDPMKDFAPLALLGSAPLVWVAVDTKPGVSSKEFVKTELQTNSEIPYGSVGVGSGGHLGMELIGDFFKLHMLHIPYNGGPAVLTAMQGNEVKMALLPIPTAMPGLQKGGIRAIAVSSAKRTSLLPEVLSLTELDPEAAKKLDIEVWNGVLAPASMPIEYQIRLKEELKKILQLPEIRQEFAKQSWDMQDISPEGLQKRILSDSVMYRELIKTKGISIN